MYAFTAGLMSFMLHLGERNNTLRVRLRAFTTVLAFCFAAINLFCFYISYPNSPVKDLKSLSRLPPLLMAAKIAVLLITIAFILVTHALAKGRVDRGRGKLPRKMSLFFTR